MRPSPRLKHTELEQLSLSDLQQVLRFHGWKQSDTRSALAIEYVRGDDSLLVPTKAAADYAVRVGEVLQAVAEAENTSVWHVLKSIELQGAPYFIDNRQGTLLTGP